MCFRLHIPLNETVGYYSFSNAEKNNFFQPYPQIQFREIISHNKLVFISLHIAIFCTGNCLIRNLDLSFNFIGIIILLIDYVLGLFN